MVRRNPEIKFAYLNFHYPSMVPMSAPTNEKHGRVGQRLGDDAMCCFLVQRVCYHIQFYPTYPLQYLNARSHLMSFTFALFKSLH